MTTGDEQSLGLARFLLWLSAIGVAVYSALYIGGLRLSQGVPDCGRQLQVAQLPSSLWTAIAAGLGALGIGRKRRWGLFMAIAAASAALYIGLLDITFDLRNSVYLMPWRDLAPELFANAVCTLLPLYLFLVVLRAPAWE
ncbi:MAG: hypothetical protein HYR72_14520 [Deltaproteobacteria bacterium]|nr:hypothetical protein [Deltaproteobacteria bacterium]MBI3389979.1 hypothetical protein [Deltaproteobacteria bacterium]